MLEPDTYLLVIIAVLIGYILFSLSTLRSDYLNRNTIEIADVYINKLEPIR